MTQNKTSRPVFLVSHTYRTIPSPMISDEKLKELVNKKVVKQYAIGEFEYLGEKKVVLRKNVAVHLHFKRKWLSDRSFMLYITVKYKDNKYKNEDIELYFTLNDGGYSINNNQTNLKKYKDLTRALRRNGLNILNGKKNTTILLARLIYSCSENIENINIHHRNELRNDDRDLNLESKSKVEHMIHHIYSAKEHIYNQPNEDHNENLNPSSAEISVLLNNIGIKNPNAHKNAAQSNGSKIPAFGSSFSSNDAVLNIIKSNCSPEEAKNLGLKLIKLMSQVPKSSKEDVYNVKSNEKSDYIKTLSKKVPPIIINKHIELGLMDPDTNNYVKVSDLNSDMAEDIKQYKTHLINTFGRIVMHRSIGELEHFKTLYLRYCKGLERALQKGA